MIYWFKGGLKNNFRLPFLIFRRPDYGVTEKIQRLADKYVKSDIFLENTCANVV
ncbi:hypothetical protein NEIELOOT_01716 [Neisseria elongata subsp. glycolytica ATCC 29315]|uniref:Uncharacterized protein n=1 Tax=Neisseria elongata subsp. glycolytica ATCC 29315 TaxID=546263 RepID=D4DRM3_NEIEG|nr:hypothetical protein NEIELOOT_01716 [Neisseria elongata subsp. glycolytica ATCC 29315]